MIDGSRRPVHYDIQADGLVVGYALDYQIRGTVQYANTA